MSMSQEERNRGLNFVRRQIAAGKATAEDIERWTDELGDEVQQIARDVAPPRVRRPRISKSDDNNQEP